MERMRLRPSVEGDRDLLVKWFLTGDSLRWFPMLDKREVENSATIWMSYIKQRSVWTVEYEGVSCGTVLLYAQKNKRLSHQALFAIIIDEKYRNRGIGTFVLRELMRIAKEDFGIEILHLEAYENNPAISLYRRLGFLKYGYQKNFIKEEDGSYCGKVMMQVYL